MTSDFSKTTVDSSRDPRQRASAPPVNGTGGVPVENGAILNSYVARYEQVGAIYVKIYRG